MSSFFTTPASQRKRKRTDPAESSRKRTAISGKPSRLTKSVRRKPRDDSISGSESEEDERPRNDMDQDSAAESTSGSGGEEETAAERRLRLAERYLENIREEVDEVGFDAEDIDRDLIAERLKEDTAESKGRLYRNLAVELSFQQASHTLFRNDSETVTSIATCPPYTYTVSKDMWLIKWRLQDLPAYQWLSKNGKKPKKPPPPPRRRPEKLASVKGNRKKAKDNTYQGHTDAILAVAASQDGRFVVTGGRDRRIIVWNAVDLKPLKIFTQHRDAVTGLAFRRGTNQLYSSSRDRTIKTWSLNELAYVETLFGHQDEVVDVAALAQERCISVGARDRTARLWKVVEETQLVFRGGGGEKKSRKSSAAATNVMEGSMDRIAMIDEETFVTGSDNGSLSLWVAHKKKPIFTLSLAHGMSPALAPSEASAESHPDPKLVVPAPQPCWITALATIPYSDVVLSGSWDGHVRAWKVSSDKKRLEALGSVGILSSDPDSAMAHEHPKLANGFSNRSSDPNPTLTIDANISHPSNKPQNSHSVPKPVARGVINDISVFERGVRGKDGVCIVVALGKEHRLGRWVRVQGGKNGALVFEVPRAGLKGRVNGVSSLNAGNAINGEHGAEEMVYGISNGDEEESKQ
jgi:ribosomal RNA-processing protein 9